MRMPGFSAESSLYESPHTYRGGGVPRSAPAQVVPAIPPCHACDHILDLCIAGRLRGMICSYCAAGICDPQEWKNPPDPFGRPWW